MKVPIVAILVSPRLNSGRTIAASMVINRPRAINPHRLRPQRQRRIAARRLSWLARNACPRRGRKLTDRYCAKVIEAQPTLGQISPSEAATVPPQTDRERLDDRRKLLTRGRTTMVRNQVRVRINGDKTAPTNEGSFRVFAADQVLHGGETKRAEREDTVGDDEFPHLCLSSVQVGRIALVPPQS